MNINTTNSSEPMASCPGEFTLTLSAGRYTDTLHWALVNQRDSLYEQATREIEESNLVNFLLTLKEIECVNQMLHELFDSLNNQLAAVRREQARVANEVHEQHTANLLLKTLSSYSQP